MDEHCGLNLLHGRTLKSVTVNAGKDRVLFVCEDGEAFVAYHMQACCEEVGIHDILGDVSSLIGSRITRTVENESSNDWPEDVPDSREEDAEDFYYSFTWTTHRIETASGSVVTFRWLGKSNGAYSESVYFNRTHAPLGAT